MLVNINNKILVNSNDSAFEYVQDPRKVNEATLRALFCPDWQSSNFDLSPKVHNGQCDGIQDLVTGTWITQATGTKRALWKKDATWNNRWYIKTDAIDDEYSHSSFSPFADNPANTKAVIVWRNLGNASPQRGFIGTLNLEAVIASPMLRWKYNKGTTTLTQENLYNGFFALQLAQRSGYYVTIIDTARAEKVFLQGSFSISNSTQLTAATVTTGFNLFGALSGATSTFNGELAFMALYAGSTPFSNKTIRGLMNFAASEFGSAKNYNYGI